MFLSIRNQIRKIIEKFFNPKNLRLTSLSKITGVPPSKVNIEWGKNITVKERQSRLDPYNYKQDIVEWNITSRTPPFRIEFLINLPSYDGSINSNVLD